MRGRRVCFAGMAFELIFFDSCCFEGIVGVTVGNFSAAVTGRIARVTMSRIFNAFCRVPIPIFSVKSCSIAVEEQIELLYAQDRLRPIDGPCLEFIDCMEFAS